MWGGGGNSEGTKSNVTMLRREREREKYVKVPIY